ncbi:MAG: Rieske 2Fe-2S domain-containing protein [Elusimicrobia bacterium]|nr:Rieske 2Fe-2S domain-containing protein [Elusimicrobiota bacterium]
MSSWVRVAGVNEIPVGQCLGVSVEGQDIGLFNVQGNICAMDNVCPHRGAPLSEGRLDGAQIVCPWHGWAFDVLTGKGGMDPGRCQKTFSVEKRGDDVWVNLGGTA